MAAPATNGDLTGRRVWLYPGGQESHIRKTQFVFSPEDSLVEGCEEPPGLQATYYLDDTKEMEMVVTSSGIIIFRTQGSVSPRTDGETRRQKVSLETFSPLANKQGLILQAIRATPQKVHGVSGQELRWYGASAGDVVYFHLGQVRRGRIDVADISARERAMIIQVSIEDKNLPTPAELEAEICPTTSTSQ